MRRCTWLAALALVLLVAVCDAGQNLRKTTCPLCDMDVKPDINASIFGNQFVYACEMAGHIDALQNQPVRPACAHESLLFGGRTARTHLMHLLMLCL